MLALTRKVDERIMLTGGITVTVLEAWSGGVTLGFEAPRNIEIFREEVADVEFLRRSNFVRGVHRGTRQDS